MNTTPSSPHSDERALVLGGGGSAGNAWLIGVIAGLLEGGVDVTRADVVIGTSAGATAAAQISSADPTQLLADILATTPRQGTGAVGLVGGRDGSAVTHLERIRAIIAASEDPADMRRRLCAAALELDGASDGSRHAQWRATVAARLPSAEWPERRVLLTAVDARTGEPVLFERTSGVDLADAVAASCAGGPPHGIGEGRYIDGGYRRSSENADLAGGYGRVLVLSPLGGKSLAPVEWGLGLAAQLAELRAAGSSVETVLPDTASLDAFGSNIMDLSTRPASARAGHDQGRGVAEQFAGFWG